MPTFADILDASPDVVSEASPAKEIAKEPTLASGMDWQSILDASPDVVPGRRTVSQREQRGPLGELVHSAVAPVKALAKSPSLLTMDDDEWYQWLKGENESEQSVDPATGFLGGAARIGGGIAGGVGVFAASEAGGTAVAGPVGSVAAPAAAFAASGAVESARAAGIKAIQEGKSKEEVVKISRQLAGLGAATGAGSALLFSGAALIPKTASALARTAGTAAIGTTAGVGGQLAENVAQKEAGLDTSPTEGLLEQAIVMGLVPVLAHARELYKQARTAKDPKIAATIQKTADDVAEQELEQADTTEEVAPAATAENPKPALTSQQVAANAVKRRVRQWQEQKAQEKKDAKPVVPETPEEPDKGISVTDEIKSAGAKTIADIQRLFPQAQLNREAARKLRDAAWGKQEQPPAKPKPPEEPPAPAAETVEKPKPPPKLAPTELTPEDLAASTEDIQGDQDVIPPVTKPPDEPSDDTGGTPVEKTPPKLPSAPSSGSATSPTAGETTTAPPAEPATEKKPVDPRFQKTLPGQSVAATPEQLAAAKEAGFKAEPGYAAPGVEKRWAFQDDKGLSFSTPEGASVEEIKQAYQDKIAPDETKLPSSETISPKSETKPPVDATKEPKGETTASPEKAAAKVEKAIDQTVVTEGAKTAKEAKSQLVEELEKAIEKAPAAEELKGSSHTTVKGKTVKTPDKEPTILTINIPGDGEFKIKNTKESRGEVLARAKRLSTTKGDTGRGKVPPSAVRASEKVLAKQEKNKAEAAKTFAAQKRSAAPTGEGHTIEGARAEAEKVFGKLSDRVSFVHEPDNPSAAYTDRNKIVVNAAKVAPGTVGKVLLEEGLHGVWNEPSVQDAWKQFRNGVTEYEIAAERSKRKGLDTSRETLKEEAAISKLLNKPDAPLAKKVWDAIIATLDKVFGVKVPDDRAQLLEAAQNFLRGADSKPDEFRYATPTTGKPAIENYTDALKDIKGEKKPLREQFGDAFDIGERLSKSKDVMGKALDGLKATGDYLIERFKGVEKVDDLLRAKGMLSAALEECGRQVWKWVRAAKKAVPQGRYQAAIRKWVDAGGDMAKLQEGARETKPQFRRAYEDAQNLSPENLKIAQETRKYHEARLQDAIDAGVLEDGVADYIHRMYERKPELGKKILAFFQSGILKTNPSLTKERVFTMDWQAEKEGFTPNQSFVDAVAEYESSLSRAIAARQFVARANELMAPDGRPVVDIKGMGIPIKDEDGKRSGTLIKPQFNAGKANTPGTKNYRADFVNREYPALSKWKWVSSDASGKPIFVQGDVAIHPDYVQRFDALLQPSQVRYGKYGHILRPALAVSSIFKQTMLDLSGFHQVQIAVHAAEHKVMPWNIAKDIDLQHPDTQLLLRSGMTIGGEYHYGSEGLIGNSLIRQVPILGPLAESYHEWLFRDFIPRVKYTMATHALERNRERYAGKMSEEQIGLKTASQANDAFGGQNLIMLERSKTAQDIARLIMLAPDFLESRAKFAASALAMGGKRFSNEQRSALLLGALTMYTTARLLNKATDDQWHNEPENLFSWVHNGQAYSLRTVQGDIMHALSNFQSFAMHRLNPVFGRTAFGMGTGRDEFGRKREWNQQIWDTVSNIVPISLRSGRERSIMESLFNAFGVTDRREQDTDNAFKLARKWKDAHGIGERGEFIYDPEKDPLRGLKVALSRSDDAGAASEIKKLIDSKAYTQEKLDAYFRRYRDLAFTGSKSNDKKWESELTDDQKQTVEAAKQHKQAIAKLYQKARGQYKQALANPL